MAPSSILLGGEHGPAPDLMAVVISFLEELGWRVRPRRWLDEVALVWRLRWVGAHVPGETHPGCVVSSMAVPVDVTLRCWLPLAGCGGTAKVRGMVRLGDASQRPTRGWLGWAVPSGQPWSSGWPLLAVMGAAVAS